MGNSGDVLLRQWVMLQRIPTEPRKASTTQIRDALAAEGYETTARTVQRDLDGLSAKFGYTNEQRGRTNLWFWPRYTRTIDIPAMEPSAATAIAMLGDHLSGLLPPGLLTAIKPYIDRSREVLVAASDHPYARWRKKVRAIGHGPLLRAPQVPVGVFDAVCHGLLKEQCLSVSYRRRGESLAKTSILHPLGLVIRDSVYYLVATAWNFNDVLQYALHRMNKVEFTDTPARRPKGFDLDKYLTEEKGFAYPLSDKSILLQAVFHSVVAVHLEERPLSEDQIIKTQPDGSVLIEASIADTQELRWWLLGLGNYVTVLEPVRLRKELVRTFRDALSNYH